MVSPNLSDAVTADILIRTSSGYNKLLTVGQGHNVAEIPVEAGATEIMFIPVNSSVKNSERVANHSTGPGVRNLQIVDFK